MGEYVKLYGSKRSLPRSSSSWIQPKPIWCLCLCRAAMPAGRCATGVGAGASSHVVTVGTVGAGPKAWDEVRTACSGRTELLVSWLWRRRAVMADLYSKLLRFVSSSGKLTSLADYVEN